MLKILLVDDSPLFLKAAREFLAPLPGIAAVECASTGAEALQRVGPFDPGLVLTDIMMPDMSGFEVIRRLLGRDAPPRVVAMTLHEGPEYRAAVLRAGAETLIPKRRFASESVSLVNAIVMGCSAGT